MAVGDPARIWLCDLTYTQQTISSDIMPAAVGCIAEFAERFLAERGQRIEVEIFKFPERLAEALETKQPPHAIGFSNYAWNSTLSQRFAAAIKKHLPETVVIFGGPNYPTTPVEQEEYVRALPMVDFYVVKEGEVAFAKLIGALIDVGFDPVRVPLDIPSVHRILPDGAFHAAATEERIWDMTQIPSPYLSGKMDPFFDGQMLPIIQTNRGCPFRCTFCVEGMSYYSRVAKTAHEKIDAEIRYIAEKMAHLRDTKRGRSDMHIADSNFGMYKEDIATCHSIAEMQAKYNYPEYINVATGKNHKDRVLEAARILNGALRLSGAVQSLDKDVLRNIDRANIDERKLMELALEASEIGANVYSEIILALPGDTKKAHFDTIRTVVEADFNTVQLYAYMLLPGTDLAAKDSVEKWGMRTKFRAIPRCYGAYDVLGEEVNVAEIEEICIASDTLSFEEYIACRRFHLVINLFYNDGVFKEVLRLIKKLGLSKFEWLERIYEFKGNATFVAMADAFIEDVKGELWDTRESVENFVSDRANVKRFVSGEFGANLIFKHKSLALIGQVEALADVAGRTLAEMLTAHGRQDALELGHELLEFARLRMSGVFVGRGGTLRGEFRYAVDRFALDANPDDIETYLLPAPLEFTFEHTEEQNKTMENAMAVYGTSLAGLARILSKVYMRRLFRIPKRGDVAVGLLSQRELVAGASQLSGLNEFG